MSLRCCGCHFLVSLSFHIGSSQTLLQSDVPATRNIWRLLLCLIQKKKVVVDATKRQGNAVRNWGEEGASG